MTDSIREYRGPKEEEAAPEIKEYKGESSTASDMNAMLNENQVEALISAIESSPLNTNGKTSELAIQAALYLTGDEPEKREQAFVDQLVKVNDNEMLHKELNAFTAIYKDFSASTVGEENVPQVLQTKLRLKRIISLISDAIDYSKQLDDGNLMHNKKKSVQFKTDSQNDNEISETTVETPKISIFDSNWFRFAAFSVLAVVILLVIVMFVQWLRLKHEANTKATDANSTKSNESENLI